MWRVWLSLALFFSTPLIPIVAADYAAHADACVHRGAGHWERHGRAEDDRFHLAHGEVLTCHDKDDGKPHPEDREEHHEGLPGHHDDHHGDDHHDHCIGRCNRDHSWWH